MPPEPAPTPSRCAVSPLDHHLEAATGHDLDTLWAYLDRGVLDEQHAHLVDRHRKLAKTQTGVIFHLRLSTACPAASSTSTALCSGVSTAPWTSWKRLPTRGTPLPGVCSPPWSSSKPQQRPSRPTAAALD